jgi:ATP-dependent Clp protease ATP-binding subunit ClpC
MTSNIGSAVAQKPGVGFSSRAPEFDAERMRETVSSAFRPEFVNRIDRIVVFRPFEREQVDALLEKELAAAVGRRGLRTRPWAIELEPGARDFLVGHGFSPQFGARPLKRAIERYLLAPLAEAIVGQGVPAGEQFLLVRANGDRLSVEFVDPDAAPEEPTTEPVSEAFDLRALVLAPEGSTETVAFLSAELARIEEASLILGVSELKARALAEVNAPGFWAQSNRYRTLGEIEYLDRFERALATAGKLSRRLGREAARAAAASERVEQLAGRLYVLDAALAGVETGAPTDVFLRIRTWHGEAADVEGESFIGMLASMYAQWAERYGMTATLLVSEPRESLFAVSGLGCGAILTRESGLHFFSPARTESEPKHRRGVVQVCCAPWVAGPEEQADALLDRARRALEGAQCPTDPVRRYRTGVAPLVRDAARGYRTGRLSDVLSGKFDLF